MAGSLQFCGRNICCALIEELSGVTNGVVLALLAYSVFSWSDALVKGLGGKLPVFEIGFFTALFAGIFMMLSIPRGEHWREAFRMRRPWVVHARAVIGLFSIQLAIYAFGVIPLVEVYALIFLSPLFVTLLSIVVLREKVGIWRWFAVIAGFGGVLLVVRPGFQEITLGHAAAFVTAFLAAVIVIMLRSLASGEKHTAILGALFSYGTVFNGTAVLAIGFVVPTAAEFAMLIAAGACYLAGHFTLFRAVKYAPANIVAPTQYLQIAWAVVIGAVFFSEYPDLVSIAGLTVIGGAGLVTFLREKVRLGSVRWGAFFRDRS